MKPLTGAPATRRPLALIGACVGLTVAFAAWVQFTVGGEFATLVVDDVGEMVAALIAGVACLWASKHRRPETSSCWRWLGWSAIVWAAGEGVWSYYEVVLHQEPFPSVADVGFLLAVPLAIVAVLKFPAAPSQSSTRARTILDGLIIASSLLFVSWGLVLGPIFRAHEGSAFSQALSLSYPIADVATAAVVLIVAARAERGGRTSLGLVAAGLLSIAVADSMFAFLSTQDSFGLGNVLDVGWFGGYLLIALAALWPDAPVAITQTDVERIDDDRIFLPYIPVVGALVFALGLQLTGNPFGPFLETTGIVLVIFMLTRQVLALLDNRQLTRTLEQRVIERTAELREREQQFAALVRNSSDVVTIVGRDGLITYQSPSSERVYGYPADNLVGKPFAELLSAEDTARFHSVMTQAMASPRSNLAVTWAVRHAHGGTCHTESLVTNLLDDPSVHGVVLNSRDVTDRTALEDQLRHQAFHDPLTGLANRALFQDRLDHAVARRQRTDDPLAVIFIDIDNFKAINDGRGHSVGDELLVAVAHRIAGAVRAADTVARLGGDEFAVLLEPTPTPAADAADRILKAMRKPFDVAGAQLFVQASLGIAETQTGAETSEELLRNADVAMYVAKGDGKNRWAQFEPAMHDIVISRLELESDLRRALDNNEFAVHYQPVVDLADGRVVGFEALARWNHPTRGLVMPDDFIAAAESTGVIVPLGEWLLVEACTEIKKWQWRAKRPDLSVNVNLSAKQLDDAGLISKIRRALSQSGLDASALTLELTESVLIEPTPEMLARLHALKAEGIRLAIDDFGTGYSSLSYLQHLPVDELKIDRAFVAAIDGTQSEPSGLIRKILELAEEFGLDTVAEGIEDDHQLDQIRRGGCELAQGFLFAEAVPSDDIGGVLGAGNTTIAGQSAS